MKKRATGFVCIALFFGILLSMTIYIGVGTILEDGDFERPSDFYMNRLFHSDRPISSFVRLLDYKMFGHIEDEDIIGGREDWLYEVVDSATDFPLLLDYVSGCPFTEEEMEKIEEGIRLRREAYAEQGIVYLVAVIPSTYTSEGEYLPKYLGKSTENTRLSLLSAWMKEQGEEGFLDLRASMEAFQFMGDLYNNTEDSINAYGAFAAYSGILERLKTLGVDTEGYRISRERVEVTTHYTDGKQIARRVGLERVIANKTVSLTNRLSEGYLLSDMTEHCIESRMLEDWRGSEYSVIVECSREWDRIQLTPFFSNTFEIVVYESGLSNGKEAVKAHGGDVLIQIIHETELEELLRME